MTPTSSNHTKLMNKLINLSSKNKLCEPVLYNNNYQLDIVEVKFNKLDTRIIAADLLLKNNKLNRILFIECKDGSLNADQADRYKSMTVEDIKNAKIINSSDDIKHEVTYIATESKINKLIKGMDEYSIDFPILVSDDSKIVLKHNHFDCNLLEELFSAGISTKRYSDTFYPFGVDDSDGYILYRLIPTLTTFMGEEFDSEDILLKTHPYVRFHISKDGWNELKGKVSNILIRISRDEKLYKFFDNNKNKKLMLKQLRS